MTISQELQDAIASTAALITEARERYAPKTVVAMYSGGNDSTTMLHLVREQVDAACHINTGIGIERTRQFVRDTCADWNLPLIEELTAESYEDIVLEYGFPGPSMHRVMYSRLKERPLRQVVKRLKDGDRKARIVLLSGIRRWESARRFYAGYEPINEGESGVVWVNPLWDWTAELMLEYRRAFPVPRNEVSDLIHMSGECLCGAFAHPGELDEIALWFPEVAERIRKLEHRAEQRGVPCRWEASPPPRQIDGQEEMWPEVGPLCTACEARNQP